jgi:hypothetical protein
MSLKSLRPLSLTIQRRAIQQCLSGKIAAHDHVLAKQLQRLATLWFWQHFRPQHGLLDGRASRTNNPSRKAVMCS